MTMLTWGGESERRGRSERPSSRIGFFLLLFSVSVSVSAESRRVPKDDWTSVKMEGAALMGELLYQTGDADGAREKFRDSLGTSLKQDDPASHWVALDLFRTAELEAREGKLADARHHLEILLNRYPDSEWSRRGRRLLDLIGDGRRLDDEDEEYVSPAPIANGPEEPLRRLQAAYRDGRIEDALREAHSFRSRFPSNQYAHEVAVLEGALWLKMGDPGEAAMALAGAIHAVDGELAAKARYLLAGAQLASGESRSVLSTMPAMDPARAPNKWYGLGQVWRAAALARLGKGEPSAALYRRVLASSWRSPVTVQARTALAEGLSREGKDNEALRAIAQAGREAERYGLKALAAACRLNAAHILYKQKRLPEAAAAYREFARGNPDDPDHAEALYQRGLSLRRAGKKEAAVRAFEELAGLHPDSASAGKAHLQLGQLYTDLGRSDKAVAHYRAMGSAARPAAGPAEGSAESMLLEAQVHYNGGRYRDAIPLYQKLLESSPEEARAKQVQDLLLLAYWNGAREDPGMLKAVDLYPDRPLAAQIRFELGGRAYRIRDCDSAEEQFQRVVSDFPKAPFVADALYYQGECRMRRQDYRGAADAFRRVVEDHPRHRLAKNARFRGAAALFEAGDHEESARAYASISRDKSMGAMAADAAFNRAMALAKLEKPHATLAAYEDLLTRFPKYARADWVWLQAGLLREQTGRFGPAAEAFAKVRGKERPTALLNAGRCREKLGQRALALRAYEDLRKLRPADDASRLHGVLRLGLLYELQNKAALARPLYREVLRLSSNPSVTEVARQRLDGAATAATYAPSASFSFEPAAP